MWESTRIGTNILPWAREVTVTLQNMVQEILVISGVGILRFLIKEKRDGYGRAGEASAGRPERAFLSRKIWELEIFLPEKCPCMADSGLMAIAVRNILVNAVRYSPAGERISVKLSTDYNVDSSTSNSFLLKEVSGCQYSKRIEKYEKYSEDTSGSGKHRCAHKPTGSSPFCLTPFTA